MRFVTAIALFALSTPALAQDGAPAPAPAAPAKEKKICRTLDVTGSMMPKRTCRTREEWRQVDEANENDVHRTLNGRRDYGSPKAE